MSSIIIFKQERDAGLAQAVLNNTSVSHASQLFVSEGFELSPNALSLLKAGAKNLAKAGETDFDLHYLKDILVTTGWNQNDDVFDPLEVWMARATPEHEPFNYEHDCGDIIGHIVDNQVIAEDGTVLVDNTLGDKLPSKFHVVTASVLYKFWDKPELQERMDRLLAEIAAGGWFVSMECLFKGFDYALQGKDGETRVVARNQATAFMTKHLRAYGGSGQYGDCKIGRVLRNITFSGKGLVRKPANPESVIYSTDTTSTVKAMKAIAVKTKPDHQDPDFDPPMSSQQLAQARKDMAMWLGVEPGVEPTKKVDEAPINMAKAVSDAATYLSGEDPNENGSLSPIESSVLEYLDRSR